jgi:hypothetical protein
MSDGSVSDKRLVRNRLLAVFFSWKAFFCFLGLLVLIALSTAGELFTSLHTAQGRNQIQVTVEGLANSDADKIRVSFDKAQDDTDGQTDLPGVPDKERLFCWRDASWVTGIRLHATPGALAKIKHVQINVGKRQRHDYSGEEVRKWERVTPEYWLVPADRASGKQSCVSLLAPLHSGTAINLGASDEVLSKCLQPIIIFIGGFALVLAVMARLLQIAYFRQLISKALLPSSVKPGAGTNSQFIWAFIAGFAVFVTGCLVIETIESYPFTQDDNLAQFLPVVIRSAETLCSGKFPVWNPYQFLGSPTTTVGVYALTYPPTYVAYLIAHRIFGNDYLTMDVYSLMHLGLGYSIAFFALRQVKTSPWICAGGSLCWALSGWFLVAGRSQATFMPLLVMLPSMILSVTWLKSKPVGWGWAIATAVMIGVGFHGGHAELWLYTILFFVLAVFLSLLNEKDFWRGKALWAVASLGIVGSIAAPLAILQMIETADTQRITAYGWPVNIPATLIPGIRMQPTELGLGTYNWQLFPEMFYNGTLFTFVSMVALVLLVSLFFLRTELLSREVFSENSWLLVGGFGLLASLGGRGVVYFVLSLLPIFNRFRWSIKYTPFFQLFFIVAGAIVLERLLPDNRKVKFFIFATLSALLLYHVTLCKCTWYSYGDRPYPAPEVALQKTVLKDKTQRLFTLAPERSPAAGYSDTMSLNFPTLRGVLATGGYDTFVAAKKKELFVLGKLFTDTAIARKALGVEWLIWSRLCDYPVVSENDFEHSGELPTSLRFACAYQMIESRLPLEQSPNISVYQLDKPDPIVFETTTKRPLQYRLDQQGIEVDIRGVRPNTSITLNFIRWPWMVAETETERLLCQEDEWERIVVKTTQQSKKLIVRYSPPWLLSFGIASIILLVSVLIGIVAKRVSKGC